MPEREERRRRHRDDDDDDLRRRRRRDGDDERRSRRGRCVRVALRGDTKVEVADVAQLVETWAEDIQEIHMNTRAVSSDEPGWQYHIVEFKDVEVTREALATLEAAKGVALGGMEVAVSTWPVHGHTSDMYKSSRHRDDERERRERERERERREEEEAERARIERREREKRESRRPRPKLLSDETPHVHLVVFDLEKSQLFSVSTEDIEYTAGGVEALAEKAQRGSTRQTACKYYEDDGVCSKGSNCDFLHVLPVAERTYIEAPPPHREGEAVGKGHAYGAWERGRRGAARRMQLENEAPYNPSDVPLLTTEDDGHDGQEVLDFDVSLLVRDVDCYTEAQKVPQMTEDDFEEMWCQIDGFVSAKLVSEGEKVRRYGGRFGIVTFESREVAMDALAQTVNCGLNISFYGVQENMEDVLTEHQMAARTK